MDILRDSINILVESGGLIKVFGKNFYNYLIIDAQKLFRLLDKIKGGDVTEEHIEEFKECIEYVGKGLKDRKWKMDHVREGKRVNSLRFILNTTACCVPGMMGAESSAYSFLENPVIMRHFVKNLL